jgi:hypothetical protein
MHRFYASHARVAAGDAWTNKAATCFCRCPPRVTACHSPQPEAAAHQAAVGWLKALSILYPLLCTLYSVLCTLLSILCLLPSAFCPLPSTLCFCLALPCLEPARPAAQMRSRGHCRSIGAAASPLEPGSHMGWRIPYAQAPGPHIPFSTSCAVSSTTTPVSIAPQPAHPRPILLGYNKHTEYNRQHVCLSTARGCELRVPWLRTFPGTGRLGCVLACFPVVLNSR